MKKLNLIAGLPRAGTTLVCQILNSNPDFHVTPTSGVIDILKNIRSTFSHNPTWKAQDRIELMPNIKEGLNGFLNGFFFDKDVVFDKCRGWSNNLNLLDKIRGNEDTKIIWFYRDPVEIVGSIEAQHQKTILLENADEAGAPAAFMTLDRRIGTFINNDSIISYPVEILKDAIEMGYADRIMFVKYYDLTNNTQKTLDEIHDFIGEKHYKYNLNDVRQTTNEWDGTYNYKFMHKIKEGKIQWKKADITLPAKYVSIISERFQALNNLMFSGDASELLGLQPGSVILPQIKPMTNNNANIDNNNANKENPFNV